MSGAEFNEGAVVRGPKTARRLSLVFTGHEYAEGTPTILDALAAQGAKASFFLTGDFLRNPQFAFLVQRMVSAGHYVGPHSDQHRLYCSWDTSRRTLVTREEFEADLEANYRELTRFGVMRDRARFFLPAFEHHNREIADWTGFQGLRLINHTAQTRSAADYTLDSDPRFVSSQTIEDSILGRESDDPNGLNGFLLLLHLGAGPGRSDKMHLRFAGLLGQLQKRGYAFVRVDELLTPIPSPSLTPVYLRANQVGYLPHMPKLGIALSTEPVAERFTVAEEESGRIVFEGRTQELPGVRWGKFTQVAELDFSAFERPGRYRLRLGETRSLPFTLGADVFRPLPDTLLEFMRQQRCGFNP